MVASVENNTLQTNLKDNSTTRTVVISVISSLIAMLLVFILIRPVFELAWPWLKNSTSDHIGTIVDGYIKNAALGDRNWVTAGSAISWRFVFLVFSLSAAILSTLLTFKISREISAPQSQVSQKKNSADLIIKSSFRILRVSLTLLWLLLPFLFYYQIKMAGAIYYDIQLNASFSQRMMVLAPVLNEQEEEQLYAQWANMTSKEDYDSINLKMEKLSIDNKTKLPGLLLE